MGAPMVPEERSIMTEETPKAYQRRLELQSEPHERFRAAFAKHELIEKWCRSDDEFAIYHIGRPGSSAYHAQIMLPPRTGYIVVIGDVPNAVMKGVASSGRPVDRLKAALDLELGTYAESSRFVEKLTGGHGRGTLQAEDWEPGLAALDLEEHIQAEFENSADRANHANLFARLRGSISKGARTLSTALYENGLGEWRCGYFISSDVYYVHAALERCHQLVQAKEEKP